MKVNYFSVRGRRKENEDFILSKKIDEKLSLHLIADGMGGYENGRLAAETVANTIFDCLLKCENCNNPDDFVAESITAANTAIKNISTEKGISLGSTIGGCLINKSKATIFWVGDVKIIHVRDNKIQFESEDHSLINQLKKNGNIDNGLDLSSIRHVVTKSIKGDEKKFNPDIVEIEIQPSDKIIICSDGILEISNLTDIAKFKLSSNQELEILTNKYKNCSDNSSLIEVKF